MADKKITQLTNRTPASTDLLLVGDPSTGYSYKTTIFDVVGAAGVSITLTTDGTSGEATLIDGVLNIPEYGSGTVSGTTNYVAKFTGATTIGDSVIYESSGSVLIGTTTNAGYKLSVNGSAKAHSLTISNPSYSGQLNISSVDNYRHIISGAYGYEYIDFGEQGNSIGINANQIYLNSSITIVGSTMRWQSGSSMTQHYFAPGAYNRGIVFSSNYTNNEASETYEGSHVISEANVATAIASNVTINQFVSSPTVNTSAGTTVLRGFYHNPTLTATTGLTNYAFESTSGKIKVSDLSGTGTRMVTCDSNGVLGYDTIPSGGGGGSLTINNNANNRLLTANGGSSSIEAESGLTWDGSTLGVIGGIYVAKATGSSAIYLDSTGDSGDVWFIGAVGSALADPGSLMFNNDTDNLSPMALTSAKLKLKVDTTLSWTSSSTVDSTTYTAAIGVASANTLKIYDGSTGLGNLEAGSVKTTALEMNSTTKAFLPPRMTTTQRNAISSPSAGMIVYDSTVNKVSVYDGAWKYLAYE